MRLIKMLGFAAIAVLAAMAFIGATSASATSTVLCLEHNVNTGLLCPAGKERTHVHYVLVPGTVLRILGLDILCLGLLSEKTPLGLAVNGPQEIHVLELAFSGCGTNSSHDNCTVTTEETPLSHLLKIGLDEGILLYLSGRVRLVCGAINCVYDLAGMELAAGAGHITAEETPVTELGGKLICPNQTTFDALLESLLPTYVLK